MSIRKGSLSGLITGVVLVILISSASFFYFQGRKKIEPAPVVISTLTPTPVPTAAEPVEAVPVQPVCKPAGESICTNPLLCPDNREKCCKGLYAVLETRSNVRCEIPSEANSDKIRLETLEQ